MVKRLQLFLGAHSAHTALSADKESILINGNFFLLGFVDANTGE
jgi:hypothetical protein